MYLYTFIITNTRFTILRRCCGTTWRTWCRSCEHTLIYYNTDYRLEHWMCDLDIDIDTTPHTIVAELYNVATHSKIKLIISDCANITLSKKHNMKKDVSNILCYVKRCYIWIQQILSTNTAIIGSSKTRQYPHRHIY
jgi:hypothetical protein